MVISKIIRLRMHIVTGTQLLIAITDARSIANAYYYELHMSNRVCYECVDLHPVPLKGMCHTFCSRKAVQHRIGKITIHFHLQNIIILSKTYEFEFQ